MTRTTKSILGGVTILGITGIICKLVGVLYRIPLAWLIGEDGVGIYALVYPTFTLLLTISSAGLPSAVSRMVAQFLAKEDPSNAKRVFTSALYLLSAVGFVAAVLMFSLSGYLSESIVKNPQTRLGFMAIAPSLFLVCIISAFRGFMQGQQDMVPTAISQLIEQVGKVVVALPLAAIGMRISLGHAAAGALLGISITEVVNLIYIVFPFMRRRQRVSTYTQNPKHAPVPMKVLMKRLAAIALPITLGACIVPLSIWVDSAMLVGRLQDIGYTKDRATELYGLYAGLVINLINVPTAFSIALSMSLVPAVSGFFSKGDYAGVARQSSHGLRLSFLIGFPCALGLSILAHPILQFFYSGGKTSAENIALAAKYMSVSGLTVVVFMVVQSTTSILQGMRKQYIPMYSMMAGIAVKVVLNYFLVGIPSVNIHGAPISSLVCYTISMVPNVYYVMKFGRMSFDWVGFVFKPLLAAVIMAAAIMIGQALLPAGRLTTIALVALGVVVYAAAALLIKAITPDDLRALHLGKRKLSPKGEE